MFHLCAYYSGGGGGGVEELIRNPRTLTGPAREMCLKDTIVQLYILKQYYFVFVKVSMKALIATVIFLKDV